MSGSEHTYIYTKSIKMVHRASQIQHKCKQIIILGLVCLQLTQINPSKIRMAQPVLLKREQNCSQPSVVESTALAGPAENDQ